MNKLGVKFYNNDHLTKEEMSATIVRAKMLMVNNKNEILLGLSHNTYQFPGGHQEINETLHECVIREVQEETGIKLTQKKIEPFFMIRHYYKDYYGSGKHACLEIYYFEAKVNEHYNLANVRYTESEKNGQFKLQYIPLKQVESVLNESITWHKINAIIVPEMLVVLAEYKSLKKSIIDKPKINI